MKLFLDRNKTLLPRVDNIYLLTRLLTLSGICYIIFSGYYNFGDKNFFYAIIGTFLLHIGIFIIAIYEKFDIKLAYLSAILYDLILIPILIIYTGKLSSSYFLLFYLTVSVAAYVLTFWFASAVALLVSALYLLSVFDNINWDNFFDISIRIGFVWIYYFAISYASRYMRKTEKRVLKLFDTLNKRTSELEKSQAQLEMIYENTRVLASILDIEGVLKEVVRIMGRVLQYNYFGIILKDKRKNLFYRARIEGSVENYHPKAIPVSGMGLIRKVFDIGEEITVKDIVKREDYKPLYTGSRSLAVLPLTSHGQNHGVLFAESSIKDDFNQKDMQVLTAVARSAGLAIENAELHRKTEELTVIDELTGIYNYRYFVRKLQEEKRRALRYSLPLSLIMVDIDFFKKLNDNYGHETGNKILKRLSVIIKSCIRDVDIFARYGGEEFVIILPQTPESEAFNIGERTRKAVEEEVFGVGKAGDLKITISLGVSSFPENGKSHEELLSVTDQALYRAKGEGRNLVRVI